MRYPTIMLLPFLLVIHAAGAYADNTVDCQKRSLADAIRVANQNDTINFTGVCGPIVIETDGLSLNGVGTAVIGGGDSDAVIVRGAGRVSLSNFDVVNGANGIVALNGANLTLTGVNAHDNLSSGISLQTASSAILTNVTANDNGLHGVDVETGSAATVTASLTTSANTGVGINVSGSSITLANATVTASNNALGIQISANSSAVLNDSATVINVTNNLATGLMVVSGGHMVSFGGTINASGNSVNGVSVASQGGLDLNAASTLDTFNNGGNGLSVQDGATLTLTNQAKILSNQNSGVGLLLDNGAGATLVHSTITGNTVKDIQLTFGTRADFSTLVFGTYACDATVLVRGTSGIVCPH